MRHLPSWYREGRRGRFSFKRGPRCGCKSRNKYRIDLSSPSTAPGRRFRRLGNRRFQIVGGEGPTHRDGCTLEQTLTPRLLGCPRIWGLALVAFPSPRLHFVEPRSTHCSAYGPNGNLIMKHIAASDTIFAAKRS
jgi:hypothetical protein